MLQRVDVTEIREMLAEYTLEPWGEIRGDLQAGILASIYVNAHKKGAKTSPADFTLKFVKPKPKPVALMKKTFAAVKVAFDKYRKAKHHG